MDEALAHDKTPGNMSDRSWTETVNMAPLVSRLNRRCMPTGKTGDRTQG
jgi:hypothetical protein